MHVLLASPWIPPEWVAAHGLQPRAAWCHPALAAHPLPVPAGVCPFAQAILQLTTATRSPAVFATTCDQMRRAFDEAVQPGGPPVFLFNLPATWQSPIAARLVTDELERLGRFLLDLGGSPPAPGRLASVLTRYGHARQRLLEAAPRAAARPFAEAMARFHQQGPEASPLPPGSFPANAIPLALVGGPLPPSHDWIFDAIESAGGTVVLNATETGERTLLPPFPRPTPADNPAAILAHAALDHCVDVFQRPNTRLLAWLETRLRARRVRGILLWQHLGCDLWRAEAATLRETFRLPLLQLEAGEFPADSPRTLGRVAAFLEMLA